MKIDPYIKDRTLAELYSYILIVFEIHQSGVIPKYAYEKVKRNYLYNKKIFGDMYISVLCSTETFFSDKDERALDVLNDLMAAGAINIYEYNTQKERHLLY